MDYGDNKNSNIIVLGVLALAAMFFGYLIHSSKQSQQPIQQTPSLDNIQTQLQLIQSQQTIQANSITQLENNKCATQTTIPPKSETSDFGMLNVVSMPSRINRLSRYKLGFSESDESVAASFGMA